MTEIEHADPDAVAVEPVAEPTGLRTAPSPVGAIGWLGVIIAIAASATVYHPLLDNYFVSDDFLNLYRIINCGFWEYVLTPHGGHTLVARNFVYYLCAWAFDTDPVGYFWVVLLTHLANVALLFVVIHRMTGSVLLACLGATVWGISPVHDGALGWYAVYGHVMAATALLLIVLWLLAVDRADTERRTRLLRACYGAALIGTVSFGVGIGIALVLPFVAALLAPSARSTARWGIPLVSLLLVVPLLYVGLFAINGYFFDEGLETPGVVAKYIFELWNTIVPNTIHLMSYGVIRLLTAFHFDPSWMNESVSYTVFGVFTAVMLAAAWASDTRLRYAIAAGALLAFGCYGFIAMGRVVFFQALTSAMMAIQPRYHYAGLISFTVLTCLALNAAGRLTLIPFVAKAAASMVVLALLGFSYAHSDFQVDHHVEARVQVDEVTTTVMSSVEAAKIGDNVYIPNRSFSGFFILPPTEFPGWAAVFAIYNRTNDIEGRHVYFVDKRLGVLISSARGRRSSRLIVPPPGKE